jgi:uncharacterized repeat protein (TIGR03809 family)
MTHRADVARSREVFRRWSALAERRLNHLTELFESGRWRRYYTETVFLENIREAKAAVEVWRDLVTREPSSVHIVAGISSTGSHGAMQSDMVASRDGAPVAPLVPAEAGVRLPDAVAAVETAMIPDQAPPVSDVVASALEVARELTAHPTIHDRYPQLRNAL